MSMPLVTVIIPIFNHARLGIKAVESVCAQTHSNLQIIVIDDGSSDNSPDILEANFGSRITIVRQGNLGPSAATNAGLRLSQGDFIALMGGDDVCSPDRIAHQLDFQHRTNFDIVFSLPKLIDDHDQPIDDSYYPSFFRKIESGQSIFRHLFFYDNFLCAPGALMKAQVVQRVGMFHEGLIQLQDYDYWLRACGQNLKLGISDHRVIAYRRHPGNLSSNTRTDAALAEIPYVLSKTIEQATPEAMRLAFNDMLIPNVSIKQPLSKFEKSLLLLAHPRMEVRTAGLAMAMDLRDDPQSMAEISSNRLDLFHYIFNTMTSH